LIGIRAESMVPSELQKCSSLIQKEYFHKEGSIKAKRGLIVWDAFGYRIAVVTSRYDDRNIQSVVDLGDKPSVLVTYN
jgi:hypothetical protein